MYILKAALNGFLFHTRREGYFEEVFQVLKYWWQQIKILQGKRSTKVSMNFWKGCDFVIHGRSLQEK